jgi:transposase
MRRYVVVFGLPRTPDIDPLAVKRAPVAAGSATNLEALRRAQAVLLPALLGATLAQTAAAPGVGRATVTRLQAAFRQRAASRTEAPARPWGGRRHYGMTLEAARAFWEPWLRLASAGSLLVVSPLRAALAQRVGHPVKASLIYRLLARHGWRKVAPDTRHPKSSSAAQADWKKNSPKRWQPS